MHVATVSREALAGFSHEAWRNTVLDTICLDDVSDCQLVFAPFIPMGSVGSHT